MLVDFQIEPDIQFWITDIWRFPPHLSVNQLKKEKICDIWFLQKFGNI